MNHNTQNTSHGPSVPNWGAAAPPRDLTGQTLADFRVERLLGHGGMGEVYLARQVSLDREVALKVLKPELASNPTYMARFESEAWAAAKVNHPNIVHIYTLGGVERLKFIAMEYVPGTNLRNFLSRKGVPELPLALSIMKQAGAAVGAAGEAGLVHRDIKPENLLLTKKGQVKVADFGLCRVHDSKVHLTQEGVALGTPLYMSPEQVQGQATDHRSDLYSLGVTFYQMLAGVPPFQGDAPLALALKHVRETPVSLAVHRPDLPAELVALVMKLLEKEPGQRYQTATEMLKDLARVREQCFATAETLPTQTSVSPAEAEALADSGEATQPARGSWLPWRTGWNLSAVAKKGLVAAVPIALIAGGAWGWLSRSDDLTGRNAPQSASMPGLWMETWESTVPRFTTPQAQYRFAQTRAEPSLRLASWIAVPGRFPESTEIVAGSYVQMIRDLLRRGDWERLQALADELLVAHKRLGREVFEKLSILSRGAAAALRNEATLVLEHLDQLTNIEFMDPAQAELGYEIVMITSRSASGGGTNASRLNKLRASLLQPLQLPPVGLMGDSGL